MSRFLPVLVLTLMPCQVMAEPPDSKGRHAEFETGAMQFLKKHCYDCHGVETQEADLRFDALNYELSDGVNAGLWRRVLEQVLFQEMPPVDSDELPDTESRERFVRLVEAELAQFGQGVNLDEKLYLPEYGNLVDHDSLFDGSVTEKPFT